MDRRSFIGTLTTGLTALGLTGKLTKTEEVRLPEQFKLNTLLTDEWAIKTFGSHLHSEMRRLGHRTEVVMDQDKNAEIYHVKVADFASSFDADYAVKRYLKPAAETLAANLAHDRIKTLSPLGPVLKNGATILTFKSKPAGLWVRMIRAYDIRTDRTIVKFSVRGRA